MMRIIALTILGLAVLFQSNAQSEYCGVGTIWDAESQTCIGIENAELLDANLDGIIGVEDLLNLLSHFGDEDMDFDGIYDSVDDCVGAYDECGVCNGPGIPEGYCSCTEQIDALGICGGDCASDTNGDGVCDEFYGPCLGIFQFTYFDHTYVLQEIGDQCWFKENLRSEFYSNGDSILGNHQTSETWVAAGINGIGAQTIFAEGDAGINNGGNEDPEENLIDFGRLYNWHAASDIRGLCPTGWHVPNDSEWQELESYLGMHPADLNEWGTRGAEQLIGSKLKSSEVDSPPWNGTNESSFSALHGGARSNTGNFNNGNNEGNFWTSTENLTSNWNAWYRRVATAHDGVLRAYNSKGQGFSVRCLKD